MYTHIKYMSLYRVFLRQAAIFYSCVLWTKNKGEKFIYYVS